MPNIDRISNLPDELLTHILSFLETNYAVQTSVLSKRWEKLWVLVPNFSITYTGEDPSYETHRSRCISFKHSIHRALASRGSTDIHSFHLVYSSCLRGDLESFTNRCLTELFRRRVREVVMDFEVELELRANPIRLSVFSCETLVNLTLLFPKSLVTLPDTVWFPELKELEIWVTDPDDSFTEKLCSGCPVLKDFTLHIFTEDDSKDIVVNICLYALKGLELNFRSCPSRDYRVILDAPVLEDLRFEDSFLAIFEIRNLMSLQSVDIELGCSYENEDAYLEVEKVFDFLRGIANANYLRLPYNSMRELTHPDEDGVMSFGDTSFVNLKHLEVEVGCFKRLSVALAKMPNLEYLEITLKCDELDQFSVVPWQTPNLKIIEVHDVQGKKVVLQFLKYVLKNAALLEEMIIEFKFSREKQFEESLLNAPRSSAECEIEFSEEEFELDDDE